jgi:hypothetical protein
MPDGAVLRFPDGTDENVMSRAMLEHLGVRPESMGPTPEQSAHAERIEVSRQIAAAQAGLVDVTAQSGAAIAGALAPLQSALAALAGEVAALRQEVSRAAGENASALSSVFGALTAEKEIVLDDKNAPIGVRVKPNGKMKD